MIGRHHLPDFAGLPVKIQEEPISDDSGAGDDDVDGAEPADRIAGHVHAPTGPDRVAMDKQLAALPSRYVGQYASWVADDCLTARDVDGFEKVLRDLSLWDKRRDRIMTLSGGMKRRVMIAKALSHEPTILFLDEPTAGVDVELRRDMWEMVRGLRENGVTIILTTHYIEEAEEMADRVGVISRGELIVVEDKTALMRKLGKKQLTLHLYEALAAIPPSLAAHRLELAKHGQELVYTITTQGRLADPQQFAQIIVRANPDGSTVRLGEVARIELGSRDYDFIGRINGKPATSVITDRTWLETAFVPQCQERGKAVINKRGLSSAFSAANGALPPNEPASIRLSPAPAIMVGIGQSARATHPSAAKVFLDFVLSRDGQKLMQTPGRLVARSDLANDQARMLKGLKIVPVDPALAEKLDQYAKQLHSIFAG